MYKRLGMFFYYMQCLNVSVLYLLSFDILHITTRVYTNKTHSEGHLYNFFVVTDININK